MDGGSDGAGCSARSAMPRAIAVGGEGACGGAGACSHGARGDDMIALANGAKAYGGQVLLRDLSVRSGRGERIGLVGPNGAGKTTLCRILAGAEDLDAGQVHLDTGVTVGYLPQEVRVGGDLTVLAEALSGWDSVWKLEAQLEDLAARMAGPDADPSLTETYGEVQHRFEALGGERRVVAGASTPRRPR